MLFDGIMHILFDGIMHILFDGIMHILLVCSSEFDLLSTATNFSFTHYFFFPPNIIN